MGKQKISTTNIVACVILVVIGLLLCILRMGLLNYLMTVVGALLIVYGVLDIAGGRTMRGILEAAIGLIIIVCGWTITTYALIVFGVLIAIKGIWDLVNVLQNKHKNTVALIAAVITIAVGIVLCVAPFAIGDIICVVVGVVFIIDGVLALFGKQIA